MKPYVAFDTRCAQWFAKNRPIDLDSELAMRQEALEMLVEAIWAGEVTSLDGVNTKFSRSIGEHLGVDQFEMNANCICTPQDWACPCCSRSKFQIARIGHKSQILAKLVVHHDHMSDALKSSFRQAFKDTGTNQAQIAGALLVERIGKAFAAYEEVLICEDCNNADTTAKKRAGCPKYFSFSIGQIRRFIVAADHSPHEIDQLKAHDVWALARPAYELRMRLIDEVAYAAATDSHWYEYNSQPNTTGSSGSQNVLGNFVIRQWISLDDLIARLGPKKQIAARNVSRWSPLRQTTCRPDRTNRPGAMRERIGSIRTSIQRQGGGAVTATRERRVGRRFS